MKLILKTDYRTALAVEGPGIELLVKALQHAYTIRDENYGEKYDERCWIKAENQAIGFELVPDSFVTSQPEFEALKLAQAVVKANGDDNK